MLLKINKTLFLFLFLILTVQNSFAQKEKKKAQLVPENIQNSKAEEYFVEGMKYYMLEDFDKALLNFKKANDLNPKNPALKYQIAHLYEANMRFSDALPYAVFAYEKGGNNKFYALTLANIYYNLNQLKNAVQVYEKLIKNHIGVDKELFDLVEIYVKLNQTDKAILTLDKFTKKYGAVSEISEYKQNLYLRNNQVDKALKEGELLIESNPDEAQYVVNQAQLLIDLKKEKEAETLLQTYLKKNADAKVMLIYSDLLHSQGKTDSANQFYLSAFESLDLTFDQKIDLIALKIRMLPQDSAIVKTMCESIVKNYPEKSKAHAIYGDYHQLIGNKKNSRAYYLKSLEFESSNFNVWEQLILLDGELEDYDSLINHSAKALEFYPNHGVFWYFNGSAHFMVKNYSEAIKSLDKAKKLSQGNSFLISDVCGLLGDAYNFLKEFEKSDKAYDEALEHNANNLHVLNNYSYYLSLRGENLEKALKMTELLLKYSPDDKTYLDTRAWVLYKNKDYKKALELLEKAIFNNNSTEVIEHYGDVLFQLNRIDEAVVQWEKSKSLGNKSEILEKKIKERKLYE